MGTVKLGRTSGSKPAYLVYWGRGSADAPCRRVDPYAPQGKAELPPVPSVLRWVLEYEKATPFPFVVPREVYSWLEEEISARKAFEEEHLVAQQYKRYEDLWDFQRESLHFGVANFFYNEGTLRALIADDPRLGKSPQALAILSVLAGVDTLTVSDRNILILCPKAVIPQWVRYVNEWFFPCCENAEVRVIPLTGAVKERNLKLQAELQAFLQEDEAGSSSRLKPAVFRVFITNWEYMYYEEDIGMLGWWAFIGDEAHKIKNRNSRISEYARRIPAKHVLLLSATFVENLPLDWWSPLNVIKPTVFSSFWRFAGWFTRFEYDFAAKAPKPVSAANTGILKEFLSPYVLQRRASEVASLPEQVFETVYCALDDVPRRFYDKVKKEVFLQLTSGETLAITDALSQLLRLRQAALHPKLLDPYYFTNPETGKIAAAVQIISELPDEQVVVYSSFIGGCRLIQEALGRENCIVYTAEDKPDKITPFLDGKVRVLATTPMKGGVGLNLFNANVVIYLDFPLSSIAYRQSVERTRALGKSGKVFVYFLIAHDTVDEHVFSLLHRKLDVVKESEIAPRILLEYFGLDS